MQNQKATILYNRIIAPEHYRMGLRGPVDYSKARPGQFVMLRVADQLAPLLRRPFSIHRLISESGTPTGFEILYRVKGICWKCLGPLGAVLNCQRPCNARL